MAGLLGYALAGGLAGYGNSLVEEAKAKREAAMEELRNSRLMEREDRDRSFRTSEREASQGFSARENAANRAQQGISTSIGADGTMYRVDARGGQASQVMAGDQPFKPAQASTGNAQRDRLMSDIYKEAVSMGETHEDAIEQARRAADELFGTPSRASPASAPAISSEPIRLEQRPDPAKLIDGQSYQLPNGTLGTWSASEGGFAPIGRSATVEDAAGQSASVGPVAPAPSRPAPRSASSEPTPPRNSDRPLTETIRSDPAATFLRDNAVGPLSGSRSDNADAPEEKTQYGRDTALASQAVQSNRRDPQRDRTDRQRAAVMDEMSKLDRLFEAGRISRAEYDRARARLRTDIARLDTENAQ
jgi:hypothetical protein